MSNTLSRMSTSLPTTAWAPASTEHTSPFPAAGSQGGARSRLLTASTELQANSSHDVDGWAAAVTGPLLDEEAVAS